MTTEELNAIVQAVIDKINKQVIDFDVAQSTPESTDLLSAVRSQNDGTYQGVTLKWDDVANAVTREAKGYRDEAASAKTNVENMKASVEQTVSDFNTLAEEKKTEVQGVYQTDLNELKGDLGDVEDRIAPIDFRQKSIGKVTLNIDVTNTMQAFMDGMEEEPNEAIALTLEPDVPTADSHNFGVRGQICIDSNYLYVCVSNNTWKKITLLDL